MSTTLPTAADAPTFNPGAMAPRPDRRRRVSVSESVLLALLFLVIFEMTCRIEDWLRFDAPMFSPITSQVDLMVRDHDGIHGRPNSRFQKWVMNSLGTRGPEAALVKPPGTLRVVAVGASETFGLSESPGREFPRQLEDTLAARLGAHLCERRRPHRVEVLNAALPGMSLPTIDQDVRNRLRRFGPDVIVVYPTPAQYLTDDPPAPAAPGEEVPLPTWRVLYPRAIGRVRAELKALLPEPAARWLRRRDTESYVRGRPAGWRFTTIPADRMDQYDRDLRHLIGTVRAAGAIPILVTHANAFMEPGADEGLLVAWERFYPRATGSVIVAFDSLARHVTLSAASDSGVAAVDLPQHLVGEASPTVFSDFSHFTDRGAALVAGALAPAMLGAITDGEPCQGA